MKHRIGIGSGQQRGRASASSRRERIAQRRARRARVHLERMRSEPKEAPPLRLVIAIAAVLSVVAGIGIGRPLVAAARSWLSGNGSVGAISITGSSRLPLNEIASATGIEPGSELTAIEPAVVSEKLATHPWIAEARVVALPTGILLVDVNERVAHAVVRNGATEGFLAVDASGMPFAEADANDIASLPRIDLASEPVRDEPNADLAAAIDLSKRLPERALPMPAAIAVAPEGDSLGYSLWLRGVRPRIVIGRDRIDERLAALSRLLEVDLEEVGASEIVDLRFADQAVLRGSSPPPGAAQAATTRGRATSSTAGPTG